MRHFALSSAELLELEQLVVEAWPAAETMDLDGWLLRKSGGPTKRGNSVAALRTGGQLDLAERIARVETWYGARQLPAVFQLGPSTAPSDLDRALEARGYRKTDASIFSAQTPAEVTRRIASGPVARVTDAVDESWLHIGARSSRFAATESVFLGFLARLGARCAYATAHDEHGRACATGLGIRSGERLGIYAMFTLAEQRRKGAARALLRGFAHAAALEGMRELYLLVDASNAAARALYAQCGFEDVYSYHYRVRDEPV